MPIAFLLVALADDPAPTTAPVPAVTPGARHQPTASAEPDPPACVPKAKKRVMPTYPHQDGKTVKPTNDYTCKYKLWIGTDGVPTLVLALACDEQFARAGLDAVQQWKFKPYEVDGVPTACTYELSVTFKP
jgi:outer membrane biosynthesis protein TonB